MQMQPILGFAGKAAVCAVSASLLLSGCSDDSKKDAAAKQAAAAPILEQAPLPDKVANEPTVRKNIVQTKCAAVPGGWGAAGTAANPGTAPVTYAIVVYFTTTSATTLNYAETKVTVEPGKTAEWKAEKQFHAQDKMLCPMPGISVVTS